MQTVNANTQPHSPTVLYLNIAHLGSIRRKVWNTQMMERLFLISVRQKWQIWIHWRMLTVPHWFTVWVFKNAVKQTAPAWTTCPVREVLGISCNAHHVLLTENSLVLMCKDCIGHAQPLKPGKLDLHTTGWGMGGNNSLSHWWLLGLQTHCYDSGLKSAEELCFQSREAPSQ